MIFFPVFLSFLLSLVIDIISRLGSPGKHPTADWFYLLRSINSIPLGKDRLTFILSARPVRIKLGHKNLCPGYPSRPATFNDFSISGLCPDNIRSTLIRFKLVTQMRTKLNPDF